jgi:hypothetical protein
MNASAAVRGLFRISRAEPAFRPIEEGEDVAPWYGWDTRIESIRNILSQGGLTIAQLSAATRRRYGNRSPYFIPATFLYRLRNGVTPHICQIVALSENTGYRFVDWLRVCGFDLHEILRLQIRLHSERTVLVTPLGDCFESFLPQTFLDLDRERNVRSRYLFAKIGASDALVCPQLPRGGIVRVDRDYAHWVRGVDHVSMSRLLWLVEQSSGLTCCQVRWIDDRQIVLLPSRPPWGRWPLRLPTEARILGLVETDVRPLQVKLQPRAGPMNFAQAFQAHYKEERMGFPDLLRISRSRSGLTFRAAHRLTRVVAQILGNREYAIALGMLSDYEAMGQLPRHIAKILSLCVVYCMDVRELMAAAGVRIDDSAKLALPIRDGHPRVRPEFPDNPMPLRTSRVAAGNARFAGARS